MTHVIKGTLQFGCVYETVDGGPSCPSTLARHPVLTDLMQSRHRCCLSTVILLHTLFPPRACSLPGALLRGSYYFLILVFNYSSHIIFRVVSGVQHNGQTIIYFTKYCLLYFKYPPGTIHSFYTIIDSSLYCTFISLWLYCNYKFILLNPFTFSLSPPNPIPSSNHQFVFCIYESVSILFVHFFCSLDSTYK